MNKKSTSKKRPVVARKVEPVVRGSDIPVKDQYSYMAWLVYACIGDNVKAAKKGLAKAKSLLAEMQKYHAWMKGIAKRCDRGAATDRDMETVRRVSRVMFK